ncbi:MAG: 4-alpha-glucanotransferase [Clostridia bacterium]|nr:4-alpha-glucanotransferase [Clostridia bacterium]
MTRRAGILMPIFSLPNDYGIGSFGKESYKFIDFLKTSGQTIWQVLPLGQTSFGDSPYQTTADVSFNPYFIDLEDLHNLGLLTKKELNSARTKDKKIDYGKLYFSRYPLLKKAFERFDYTEEFLAFKRARKYENYALFMALKGIYGDLSNFPPEFKARNKRAISAFKRANEKEVDFYLFIQFIAEKEYFALKKYANENGVKIMGDLPLYVALDSADVWSNPEVFKLDENLIPSAVAGVPPDYFSADGQLWGNPLYNYEAMKKDGFSWWKKRIRNALKRYDYLRIDHFRGLDRFWEIPFGSPAKDGKWQAASGREILKTFKNRLIAEDLGTLDDGVHDLLRFTGYPGMKVLLFAFDGSADNLYLPKNIGKNSVCYIGTHDNDTALGFAKKLNAKEFATFKKRANAVLPKGADRITKKADVSATLIETAYSTRANAAIISYADVLGLDNRYRINEPSTVGNWAVRFKETAFTAETAKKLKDLVKRYKR